MQLDTPEAELNTYGFSQELQQRLMNSSARLAEVLERSALQLPSRSLQIEPAPVLSARGQLAHVPQRAEAAAASSFQLSRCEPCQSSDEAPAPPEHTLSLRKADDVALTSFASAGSPLFEEYLELLGPVRPDAVGSIGPDDALIVIDLQADFVPRESTSNPHGGRFGVAEGDKVVPLAVHLIEHFVAQGAAVVATRDYHPVDHVSFLSQGGPFPAHCVQGTAGAHLLRPIADALAAGVRARGPSQVAIAFKAMHEDVDSFGGLPYVDGGEGRIGKRGDGGGESGGGESGGESGRGTPRQERALACPMGCAAAPWTGSLVLKQSGLLAALSDTSADSVPLDMNCPPDVFAALGDGGARGACSLGQHLRGKRRLFVCGLALDFCVLDTALNAALLGFERVYMVLDAARAAHIPGVGSHGSGFLSDPVETLAKLESARVGLVNTYGLLGRVPSSTPTAAGRAFPAALGPLGLLPAALEVAVEASGSLPGAPAVGTYCVALRGGAPLSSRIPGIRDGGRCSPWAPLPAGWPGAPPSAVSVCWAYPVEGIAHLTRTSRMAFLDVTSSAEHQFAAYGGFLLRDATGAVVGVQAVGAPRADGAALAFGPPRAWRHEFTTTLGDAGRFQPVTLPPLLAAGAEQFCWVAPREAFEDGSEIWSPATHGAFLYLRKEPEGPIWFPCEAAQFKAAPAAAASGARSAARGATKAAKAATAVTAAPPAPPAPPAPLSRPPPPPPRGGSSGAMRAATARSATPRRAAATAAWTNPLAIGKADVARHYSLHSSGQ